MVRSEEGVIMDKDYHFGICRNQRMPTYSERSLPQEDNQLRSVISNLRCIIAKKDAEIERLQRMLADKQCAEIRGKC